MKKFRDYELSEKDKKELIELDVLYRINASKSGQYPDIKVGLNQLYDEHLDKAFFDNLIEIQDDANYTLTKEGESRLKKYAELYQKFKDYAIFKCVYLDEDPPEEGEPDQRFGDFEEESDPDNGSEDLRFAIFENYGTREKKRTPLHILLMMSQMENRDLDQYDSEKDWIWDLINGSYFTDAKNIIDTQVSLEVICPDEVDLEEFCDEIVGAGFMELKRCFDAQPDDDDYYSPELAQESANDFWVEEVVIGNSYMDPYYYDPYFDPYYDPYYSPGADIAISAMIVGTFMFL
ncbi:MAG: hypothetical protein COA79_00580 [Planctomycetota bacterium]|nr:MAG: hypothetical protein COA79_00580 [Planctomycetota bacterium]